MQDPNERRIIQEEVIQTPEGADARVVENRVRIPPTVAEQQLGSLERIRQVIWFIAGLIVALIALRFVLLALGANPDNGFARFVYGLSGLFVAPFIGIFGPEPAAGTNYFELASIIAIAVWLLVAWVIVRIVSLVMTPKTPPLY
jgi:YggT family protein